MILLKGGQEICNFVELLLLRKRFWQLVFQQCCYLLASGFPEISDIVNDEFLEIIIIKTFVLNIGCL